jgi:hypothetical protein
MLLLHQPYYSATLPQHWKWHAHLVAGYDTILNYQYASIYILKTCFAKKPKHPV